MAEDTTSGAAPLPLAARLAHAFRVRSPLTALLALMDGCGRAIANRWWTAMTPWYTGRLVQSLGLAIRVDGSVFTANDRYFAGLLFLGTYEMWERYAVAKHLPRDMPVVELGASIGVVSCLINRLLLNPASHFCVEANPALIPLLAEHRAMNGCSFQVFHGAIAYGADQVDFAISGSTVSSSLTSGADTLTTVSVPATSLRQILQRTGIDRCSVVCDIEGAEESLVKHEADVLRNHVGTLILEVHRSHLGNHGVEALATALREAGFGVVWKRSDRWVLAKAENQ